MVPTLAFILVAACFAAAKHDTTSSMYDITTSKSTDETTIHEYIKEFFKWTGHGQDHANVATGNVVPEHIKIYLCSSPEDILEGTLVDYVKMLQYPHFNTSLETKVFIHGWLEKEDRKLNEGLSTLFALRGERVNHITVDWSKYSFSHDFNYVKEEIVPKIAKHLIPMVQKVIEMQKNNRVHLIGFDSIGSNMAGLVGKRIHGPKIARIAGLSPAGRFYNDVPQEERLTEGDAEYVDVIHTNMDGAGIFKPIGDVDFLPNGGRYQPAIEGGSTELTRVGSRCHRDVVSHMLAQLYYVESVELGYRGFIGKKCESWTNFLKQKCALHESEVMGEPVSRRVNGTVYLNVNKKMKYSMGIYGIYPYGTHHSYTSTPSHV